MDLGCLDRRAATRKFIVSPVSTMSSTKTMSRPFTGDVKSSKKRTSPEETVLPL